MKTLENELRMPWGDPFLADTMVDSANLLQDILKERKYKFTPLWRDFSDGYMPELRRNDKGIVTLLASNQSTDQRMKERTEAGS